MRFGIIGYGKMGKIRERIIGNMPDCEIVSIYDPTIDGTLLQDIISDESIDSVIVSCPNKYIKRHVIDALKSGKHVFSEKPPGISLSETEIMRDVSLESDKKLTFGFNHRFHGNIAKAKEFIDNKTLGETLWIRGVYGKGVDEDFYKGWRSDLELMGGGILLDQGIHLLDILMFLIGPFKKFESITSNFLLKNMEDNVFVIMENEKGQVASMHSTMSQWDHKFLLEIGFENGYVIVEGLETGSGTYAPEKLRYAKKGTSEQEIVWSIDQSWRRELESFVDLNKDGNSNSAVEVMKIIGEIYEQYLNNRG